MCKESANDKAIAAKILNLSRNANSLETRLEEEGMDAKSVHWTKIDANDVAAEFSRYDKTALPELTLCVYQIRMAGS